MPPVVAALPLIASVVVAVIKVSALVKALILVAATVAVMLLKKKPRGNRIADQGYELSKKIVPDLPRSVAVGLTATGGSVHFASTRTTDPKVPNNLLYRVIQLSDQPCNSLVRITEGKTVLTFNGDVTTGWRDCTSHRSKSGAACMWVRVYLGSFTPTADATLISESGGKWTSNHKGNGLCYAIVKYQYDTDAFSNGEPELVFVLQGAKCYDDRLDSTVPGGSGTQRLATPSTWAYTDNTAVVAAQYLRGFKIGGKIILGVGADARDLSTAMLFSAYNTCDQLVPKAPSGTQKRYTCGAMMSANEAAEDHLADLSLAMDGSIYDRGGAITLWPGAVRTPVMDVQAQDIDWSAEKSWQPKAALDSLINHVAGNFIDAGNFFQSKDLPQRVNAQWELDDGGQRFSQFFSMRAVTDWSQGQRTLKRIHDAGRFTGVLAVVGGVWLIELEQGDWVTATLPRFGLSGRYFQVEDITLTKDVRVALVLREVSTTLDTWAPASDEFARTDSTWTPSSLVFPVPAITVTPRSFIATSGIQMFGFRASPTGGANTFGGLVAGIQFEYALTSDLATTISAGTLNPDQPFVEVTGLLPSTSYSVRARTTDGVSVSDWSAWVPVTTDAGEDIAVQISGPIESTDFLFDYLSQPIAGQFPRDLTYKLVGPSGQISLGTLQWSWRVLAGKVNNRLPVDSWQNLTTGALGTLTVTSLEIAPATIEIRVIYGTRTITMMHPLVKVGQDPALYNAISDDILDMGEKQTELSRTVADLEARYQDIAARATVLGLSTTALTAARTNWLALLNSYNPAWNKTDVDTTIYTHWFADKNFSTPSWTLTGAAFSTGGSNAYVTVTDNSATVSEKAARSKSQAAAATQYSIAFPVKKDAVGKATRFATARIIGTAGTVKTADLSFDTSTGEVASTGTAAFDDFGVLDLGTDWLFWATFTTNANNTGVTLEFYPSMGVGDLLAANYGVAAQGSVDVLGYPRIVLGDWKKLGHIMLHGRLAAYSEEIAKITKDISFVDASTAYKLDPLSSYTFPYAYDGTQSYTSQNVVAHLRDQAGSAISSGVTWKYVVINGTVNGNAAGATEYNMTVDVADAYIPVTSLGSNTNRVEIRAYIGAIVFVQQVSLNKQFAAAPPPGGGGGGGTLPQSGGINTSIVSSTPITVLTLTGTTASGQTSISFSGTIDLHCDSFNKSGSATISWKVERFVSGTTWTAIASGGTGSASCSIVNWEPFDGTINISGTDTGRSGSTSYTYRIQLWRSAGADSATCVGNGVMT